jgi:peroxiredoxin
LRLWAVPHGWHHRPNSKLCDRCHSFAPWQHVDHVAQDIVAEQHAIIFMYPKANTAGCTTQAIGFKENYTKLLEKGYKVRRLDCLLCTLNDIQQKKLVL